MEYIIWITLYLMMVIILNGLFNKPKPWQEKVGFRINGILNERFFKDLLSFSAPDNEFFPTAKLAIHSIYFSYLEYLGTRECRAWPHLTNLYTHNLVIPKIKFSNPYNSIRALMSEIEKRDAEIIGIIGNIKFTDFGDKMKSHLKNRNKNLVLAPKDYSLVKKHLVVISNVIPTEISGTKLWEQWGNFEEYNKNCEFEDADHYIKDLLSLKIVLIDISYSIKCLLCESVDKESDKHKLDILIQERDQLKMLSWCLTNYYATWATYAINRYIMRLLVFLFIRRQ